MKDRIFAGVYSTGISYADRQREEHGDYKKLAFLSFDTLELKLAYDCPSDLAEEIKKDAGSLQARKGEEYEYSSSGQKILLGYKLR